MKKSIVLSLIMLFSGVEAHAARFIVDGALAPNVVGAFEEALDQALRGKPVNSQGEDVDGLQFSIRAVTFSCDGDLVQAQKMRALCTFEDLSNLGKLPCYIMQGENPQDKTEEVFFDIVKGEHLTSTMFRVLSSREDVIDDGPFLDVSKKSQAEEKVLEGAAVVHNEKSQNKRLGSQNRGLREALIAQSEEIQKEIDHVDRAYRDEIHRVTQGYTYIPCDPPGLFRNRDISFFEMPQALEMPRAFKMPEVASGARGAGPASLFDRTLELWCKREELSDQLKSVLQALSDLPEDSVEQLQDIGTDQEQKIADQEQKEKAQLVDGIMKVDYIMKLYEKSLQDKDPEKEKKVDAQSDDPVSGGKQ